MKRFLFAVAVVALAASAGGAEDKPAATPPATATPVVVGTPGTPVVEYGSVTTASPRRGLFARLRNRGTSSTYTTGPVTTVPTTGATPMPPATPPAPMPMPGKTSATPMPGTTGVVMASGTDSGTVMTASYSEPAKQRRGLFGRLRNR